MVINLTIKNKHANETMLELEDNEYRFTLGCGDNVPNNFFYFINKCRVYPSTVLFTKK